MPISKIPKTIKELYEQRASRLDDIDIFDEGAPKIKAYHGSPHDFDRFSTEQIGTGEGAQQYGHGLYFTETEDVAKGYRDAITRGRTSKLKKGFEETRLEIIKRIDAKLEQVNPGTDVRPLQDALDHIHRGHPDPDFLAFLIDEKKLGNTSTNDLDFSDLIEPVAKGRMYEVDIDASPDELLVWDKPFDKQSDKVKSVLRDLPGGDKWEDSYGHAATGTDQYRLLKNRVAGLANEKAVAASGIDRSQGFRGGKDELTSRFLDSKGIKGIQYADAFTRHKPPNMQSSNYVIFDDRLIDISKKYGISIPAAYMMVKSEDSEAGMHDIALRGLRQGMNLAEQVPAQFNRGVRIMAKRASLSPQEKSAIGKSLGAGDSDLAMSVARDWKKRHPTSEWVQPKIIGASINDDKKVKLKFESTPYAYNIDPRTGKKIKVGSTKFKKISDGVADEVIDYFKRAENPDDWAAANVINNAGWYKNVERRLRNEYGSFSEMMGDLLGATSAKTPVATNFRFSKEILDGFARGEFDDLMEGFADALDTRYALEDQAKAFLKSERAFGRKVKDIEVDPAYTALIDESKRIGDELREQRNIIKQPNGKQFGTNSYNAMVALADKFRIRRVGNAPKAKNFAGNLVGASQEATIDVWSARNLRKHSGRKPIPSSAEKGVTGKIIDPENFVSNLEFGFGQDVIRDATDKINDFIGPDNPLYPLGPRDVQALQWFAEKDLWTRKGWTSKVGEGGSFEQMLDADPVESMFLGLSREQSMETQGKNFVPTSGQMLESMSDILKPANTDPDVVTYKGLPTKGAYLGSPETALDIDIVSRQDFIPAETLDLAAVQAVEDAQDSWFVARRIKDSLGESRSEMFTVGSEIFFNGAKPSDSELIQDISDFLVKNEIPAYTMIVDPRDANSVIGLRILDIPQFSGDAKKYATMSKDEYKDTVGERYGQLRDLGEDLQAEFGQIKTAAPAYFDVNVKSLADTKDYLGQYGAKSRDPEALRQEFYGFKPAQERFRQWEGQSLPFYRKYKAPNLRRGKKAVGLGGLGFIGGVTQAEESKGKGLDSLRDYGPTGPSARDFVEASAEMGNIPLQRIYGPTETPFSELTGIDQAKMGQQIKNLIGKLPPHMQWMVPGEAIGDLMARGAYGDDIDIFDRLFAGLDMVGLGAEGVAAKSALKAVDKKAAELTKDKKINDWIEEIDIFTD